MCNPERRTTVTAVYCSCTIETVCVHPPRRIGVLLVSLLNGVWRCSRAGALTLARVLLWCGRLVLHVIIRVLKALFFHVTSIVFFCNWLTQPGPRCASDASFTHVHLHLTAKLLHRHTGSDLLSLSACLLLAP